MKETYKPLELIIEIIDEEDIVTTSSEHDNGYTDIEDLL